MQAVSRLADHRKLLGILVFLNLLRYPISLETSILLHTRQFCMSDPRTYIYEAEGHLKDGQGVLWTSTDHAHSTLNLSRAQLQ